MTEAEKRAHRCCFLGTMPGPRPVDDVKVALENRILEAIKEGYTTFITGMVYGPEIWAGNIVVRLRRENKKLRLIAAVPFEGFEERWSGQWAEDYAALLKQADKVMYLEKTKTRDSYRKRNEWAVNHSSCVIAVTDAKSEGLKASLAFARKQKIKVVTMAG